jgi:hypothetical protein
VEVMMGTYNLLDLVPKGRGERDVGHKMEWVRHHDRYESAPLGRRLRRPAQAALRTPEPAARTRTEARHPMDIEVVRTTLEQASLTSLAIGLAIGFFFSFNPVALAAIPVSLAYVTQPQARQQSVRLGSMFVLGMIATHASARARRRSRRRLDPACHRARVGPGARPGGDRAGARVAGMDPAADSTDTPARAAHGQYVGRGRARGLVLGGGLSCVHARIGRPAGHCGRRRFTALWRAAVVGVQRWPRRPDRARCIGDELDRSTRQLEALAASAADRGRSGPDPVGFYLLNAYFFIIPGLAA